MLEKYNDTENKDSVDGEGVLSESEDQENQIELNVKTLLDIGNIVPHLTDQKAKEIASEVIEGYISDKASRSHREQRMQDAMDLAMQKVKEKTEPWENCANVILPLITTAAMSFAARAYPAIIRDDAVAKVKVIGNDDGVQQIDPNTGQPAMIGAGRKKARGKRVVDFQNWQLLEQSPNWETDTDRLLHILPVTGNVYRKWSWNDKKPLSGLIFPKNFIVDYYTTNLDTARKTHEYTLYAWEIKERILSEEYVPLNENKPLEVGRADDKTSEIVPDSRGGDGIEDSDTAPHLLIEQHVRLDLDKDGYEEPYIAKVHIPSQTLVSLEANYQRDGLFFDESESKILKIVAEIYFVKYGFVPSPDGSFYDLGLGDLLYNINETANSIVNRLLDSGSLASTSSGFIGRGMKIKGGNVKVRPGEFPVIDTRGGSIRDNFVQIQHPEPSRTLFDLLGLLIEMADKIAMTNQIMTGEESGNMAGVTVLQLVEQGLTGFKSIYKRIYRSIKQELGILYRLNQLYLPLDIYTQVLDTNEADIMDFKSGDFDIVPVADPSMLTDSQRIARAQVLSEYKDDPRIDGVKVLEDIFDAIGADKKMVIGNPPPQEDPMIEMQKMLIQVEQYKAQIKEQEMINKSQLMAAETQTKQLEYQLKAQIETQKAQTQSLQNQIKLQEQEFKLRLLASEGELNGEIAQRDYELKEAKTKAEIEKIEAQRMEIVTKTQLERHGMEMDLFIKDDKIKREMESSKRLEEESTVLLELKKGINEAVKQKDASVKELIKPLTEVISLMKAGNEARDDQEKGELEGVKHMIAQVAENNDAVVEAIRSLKETPEKPVNKRFKVSRNKDGSLEGEIIVESDG